MTFLGNTTLTVVRFDGATYVDGEATPGTRSEFTIEGSAQPLDPRAVELLDSGVRSRARYVLYVEDFREELRVASQYGSTRGDRVVVDGEEFEVHSLAIWTGPLVSPIAHRSYALVSPQKPNAT